MNTLFKMGIIGAGLLLSANAVAANSKFACEEKVFEAVTANGQKEVRFCITGNHVVYTFGKVKSYTPELDIRVPFSKASYTYWRGGMAQAFTVKNGTYTYGVRGGLDIRELVVTKNDREIAVIPIGKIIESNIDIAQSYNIVDDGM